ncbi:unnamed protein product [Ectocarpus sp. 12 AP-2014]
MAKSIRSKVKKRNRTEMRKNVGDPHQRKLQARCTAKIQKSVAFSAGESVTKLKGMLTAAQAANPPSKEVSKSGFSFRHPDAPPPFDDDNDEASAPAPSPSRNARGRTRGRARSLSDAEASMVDEDTAMGDVGDGGEEDAGGGPAGGGSGDGVSGGAKGGEGGRNTASELAAKLKKKRRQAKRRNYVEFPAHEN